MEEPPGGYNHGRSKSPKGTWLPLESVDLEQDSPAPLEPGDISSKRNVEPRKHGSAYTYQKIGCRCYECRYWWSNYSRERRRRGKPL